MPADTSKARGTTRGRLAGRVALITGASRGIGAALAERFAREGARLVLTARTTGGLEEVDDAVRGITGEGATLVPLDLADFAQIDTLGAALYERFGHLDVLIGNAGQLGTLSPLSQTTPDDWERVMAVNLTANWRLIRSLDPLLRASDAGRVVFVTSAVARKVRAYWGAYAISKAALEMAAMIYAAEVAKTPVRVNIVNPGPTRTAMRAEAYPGEDPETLKSPEDIADLFVELAEPACERNGELVNAP